MLKLQIIILTAYSSAKSAMRSELHDLLNDERGEITSTVAIIGVLVVGALAAGAIVVTRMQAHAKAIPAPGAGP